MEYYLVMKKKKIIPFVSNVDAPRDYLSEVSQSEEQISYHLYMKFKKQKMTQMNLFTK